MSRWLSITLLILLLGQSGLMARGGGKSPHPDDSSRRRYLFFSSGWGRTRQSDAIDYHRQVQGSYGLHNIDLPLHDDFPVRPLFQVSLLFPYKQQFFLGAAASYSYSGLASEYADQYGRVTVSGSIQFLAVNALAEYDLNMNGPMRGYTILGLGLFYGKARFGERLKFIPALERSGQRELVIDGVGLLAKVGVGFNILYRRLVIRPEAMYHTAATHGKGTPKGAGLFPLAARPLSMELDFSGLYFRIALGVRI